MSTAPLGMYAGQVNVSLPGTAQPVQGSVGASFAVPNDKSGYDITWDLYITGTAPGALQVDLQGSFDQAFTNPGQVDTYNLLVSTMRFVTAKQVPFLRLNIVTFSGGDATTRILGRIYVAKRGAGV